MSEAVAPAGVSIETVLQDEGCSFNPVVAATTLAEADNELADMLVRVAASPLMGGKLLPADVGEAAEAMGPAMFRRVVIWRQLLQATEDASPMIVQRSVALAGIAVHGLGSRKDADKIADAITMGLAARVGNARLLGRLESSPFSALLARLTGERLTKAERFFFGSSGQDEADKLAQRWNLPTGTADAVAPEPGSPQANQQEVWALKLAQLKEDDEAWQTIEQVATMLGHENVQVDNSPASVDASGLAVLSSLLGVSEGASESHGEDRSRVQSALELSGDPRFIWAFAECAVNAASRFRTPLSIITIACSGDSDDDAAVSAQVSTFQAVKNLVRTSDAIGLLDAGHFLIVLPGTKPLGARTLCERMSYRLQTAADDRTEIYACSPHHVYSTSLNQEPDPRPTAEQLIQTALDGLLELKRTRGGKQFGWNMAGLSIFRP